MDFASVSSTASSAGDESTAESVRPIQLQTIPLSFCLLRGCSSSPSNFDWNFSSRRWCPGSVGAAAPVERKPHRHRVRPRLLGMQHPHPPLRRSAPAVWRRAKEVVPRRAALLLVFRQADRRNRFDLAVSLGSYVDSRHM